MARRTRKNPRTDYLSTDAALNRDADFYFPGTLWDYYELGDFPNAESVPVNRRNPRAPKADRRGWGSGLHPRSVHKAKTPGHYKNSAKAMSLKHEHGISLQAAWDVVKGKTTLAQAKANPGVKPYWPRNSVYEISDGPYNQPFPLPPNRRNSARNNPSGKVITARWPGKCHCGRPNCQITKGNPIIQIGTGPKGGKSMANVNCVE